MNRFLKITYLVFFFTALALPALHFFGAKESWHRIHGAERIPDIPTLTLKGFVDRSYQSTLTEHFSKAFFLRNTFYSTQRQINEAANFGLSHPAGYKGNKTIEGKVFDTRNVGYPIQTVVAKAFNAQGIKTIDGLAFFNDLRRETKTWLYPPGGTHLTCLASARLAEEIVRRVNAAGRIRLDVNPLTGVVERPDAIWSVDNDISLLLNHWKNPHIDTNCHYFPVFKHEHKVMNEGSAFILGDCYREQMEKIFADSGLFAKDKILISKRKDQRPEDFKNIIGDLKLVVLTFQSFNSALLNDGENYRRTPDYDLYEELRSILTALRTAKLQVARK